MSAQSTMNKNDWLVRCGDGVNLTKSCGFHIWGTNSKATSSRGFFKTAKAGDRLWFVSNNSRGMVLAAATYCSHNQRRFNCVNNNSMTDDELRWEKKDNTSWDIEIHYSDYYSFLGEDILTNIQGVVPIRRYNPQKCEMELPIEVYDAHVRHKQHIRDSVMRALPM